MSDGKYFTTTKKGKKSTRARDAPRGKQDRTKGEGRRGQRKSLVLFFFFGVVIVCIDRSARKTDGLCSLFPFSLSLVCNAFALSLGSVSQG